MGERQKTTEIDGPEKVSTPYTYRSVPQKQGCPHTPENARDFFAASKEAPYSSGA